MAPAYPGCPIKEAVNWMFNLRRAIAVSHTHAEGEGQRSLSTKVRVETDGQQAN